MALRSDCTKLAVYLGCWKTRTRLRSPEVPGFWSAKGSVGICTSLNIPKFTTCYKDSKLTTRASIDCVISVSFYGKPQLQMLSTVFIHVKMGIFFWHLRKVEHLFEIKFVPSPVIQEFIHSRFPSIERHSSTYLCAQRSCSYLQAHWILFNR